MKEVWQKAAEQICEWTKVPWRHNETWWWNDKVAVAIEEKICNKIWPKTKTASDRNKYKEARRNARRSVALAQKKTRQELGEYSRTKMSTGLQSKWQNPHRCSRSKLYERCKWKSVGRK